MKKNIFKQLIDRLLPTTTAQPAKDPRNKMAPPAPMPDRPANTEARQPSRFDPPLPMPSAPPAPQKTAVQKSSAAAPSPLKQNHRVQFQLIDYYANQYQAEKHNLQWFQKKFDIDNAVMATAYTTFQSNKARHTADGTALFTEFLFARLQNEAANLNADSKTQNDLKTAFNTARYYAHSHALLNGHGSPAKQRAHTKRAAKNLNESFAQSAARQNTPHDLRYTIEDLDKSREHAAHAAATENAAKALGYPGARFALPRHLAEYRATLS